MKRFLIIIFCCVVATVCVVAVILSGIFANEDEIQLAFSNSILQSYDMPTENGKYILYYSQEENYEQAFNSKQACQVYFSVLVNSGASNKFIFSLSNSNIILDREDRVLTGNSVGDCRLTLTAKDGSGVVKNFDFIVKQYSPPTIGNNGEYFIFTLASVAYNGELLFDGKTLICSLFCANFEDDYITLVINVSLGNMTYEPEQIFDNVPSIEDEKNIVIINPDDSGVQIGGDNLERFTINLQKTEGTVIVKFTNSALELEEEITIVIS